MNQSAVFIGYPPVEGIDAFSSFLIIAFLHQLVPHSLEMTASQFLVVVSKVSFFVKIHLSNLLIKYCKTDLILSL